MKKGKFGKNEIGIKKPKKSFKMALDLSILSPPSTPPMHELHHAKVRSLKKINYERYLVNLTKMRGWM